MFLMVQPLLFINKKHPVNDIPEGKFFLLALRGTCGITSLCGVTWVLTMVPLSLTTVLFNLAPFWVSILGYLLNGEPVQWFEYLAMIISFLGVFGIAFGGDT